MNSQYQKWKTQQAKINPHPPKDFLEILQNKENPAHIRLWNKSPDNWLCPICKRNKYQIVSYNQKKEIIYITYQIKNKSEAWYGLDRICESCWLISQKIKRELDYAYNIKFSSIYEGITPDDLQWIIIPAPHSHHNIFSKRAIFLIRKIISNKVTSELNS